MVFVVRMSSIGDVVLCCAAVQGLANGGFRPIFITQKAHKDIVACMPGVQACWTEDDVLGLDHGSGTLQILKKNADTFMEGPVHILDLHVTRRSRAMVSLLKKKWPHAQVWNVEKKSLARLWTVFKANSTSLQQVRSGAKLKPLWHHQDLQMVLVQKFLASHKDFADHQSFFEKFTIPKQKIQRPQKPYVILFPFTSFVLKNWPLDNYLELIRILLDRTEHPIVVCAGPDNAKVLHQTLGSFPSQRVWGVIPKTLPEAFWWIEHSHYVVTGDSFAVHVADALGKKGLVLYGSTSPELGFAPKSPTLQLSHGNLSCSPCSRHGSGSCRFGNVLCLQQHKPQVVGDVVIKMLSL